MTEYPKTGFRNDEVTDLLPRLRHYALSLTRDRLTALELLNATAKRALEKKHKYSSEKGQLIAWLNTMMYHLWISEVRAKKSQQSAYQKLELEVDSSQYANSQTRRPQPLAGLVLKEVMRGIDALPAPQKEALLLAMEGVDYETIAQRQGVEIGTVKSRVSRARKLLRELVPDEFL